MVCNLLSLGLNGIHGYPVTAECALSGGLPAFDVVGLPDAAVKESRERVRSAIRSSGFDFPVSRITINLAPADRKKVGTVYDLPILLGILSASGQLSMKGYADAAFLGELSLSGALRPVSGILPMALAAVRCGVKQLFVPADNAPEASLAQGLEVYGVETVAQLCAHLKGEVPLSPTLPWTPPEAAPTGPDFADVKGQEGAKRALEVAAAGGHHILMTGSPGAGKSMMAKRLPSILPDLTREEALACTEIYSVVGLTSREHPMVLRRPFRAPHHTISAAGMAGGSANLRPGEISLAHNGVLFLDELPEFHKDVLEALRQPMEDGVVTITRVGAQAVYPARFMLVCSMNPCPCGHYGSRTQACRCTPNEIRRYLNRISGPLLDRIDLHIEVESIPPERLADMRPEESSASVRSKV